MMIELCVEEEKKQQFGACLRVLGVGGAGGNAVNSMIATAETKGVEFIAANTDAQALERSSAPNKIQLGARITKGLGAGSNPDVGRRAAEEDIDTIVKQIENADILFLTAGLGGGTGSGSLPVIAGIAREMGILTVAIVTKPFLFEGKRRLAVANSSVEQLKKVVDTLIVVPNQRLLEIVDAKISMLNAFALSNDILNQAIKGISDIITKSGHINVDFADVRTIMKDMGMAIMGTGRASGPDRAKKAALAAITSPLLENVSIEGAKGVLINITGNSDLGLYEINEAASTVYGLVSEDANIILGSVIDTTVENDIIVTVIATGFQLKEKTTTIKAATYEHNYEKAVAQAVQVITEQPVVTQPIVEQPVVTQPAPTIEQAAPAQPAAQITEQAAPEVEHLTIEKQLHTAKQKERFEDLEKRRKEQEDALDLKDEQTETSLDLHDFDTPTFLRKKQELQKKFNPQQNKKAEEAHAQEIYDREVKKQQEKRNSQLQNFEKQASKLNEL